MKNIHNLSQSDALRYARHLSLPAVGLDGQKKLHAAKVLCVGAGGLGCPTLQYLAAAGIGTLGVVDGDTVELSNLQRQILFTEHDLGQNKADVACEKLQQLNSSITVNSHPFFLTVDNAFDLIQQYDVIIDGSDNYATRYLVNDVCYFLSKPNIFASIFQFEGQCSVFVRDQTPCYRCVYAAPPLPELIPNCAEGGVLGVLPGTMGLLQATEAIKIILNLGQSLAGRLLVYNALSLSFREFTCQKNPQCCLCAKKTSFEQLPRYAVEKACELDTIEPLELKALLSQSIAIKLLDVREEYEYQKGHLEASLIPLRELVYRYTELNPHDTIIIYCKIGMRSQAAMSFLKSKGFTNVRHLSGGILAWAKQVDTSMIVY